MSPRYAFIDEVKVWCESGKGGDGAIHFRREKYVEKGGPDGGDGGRGGHVIVRGNRRFTSLLHLRYQPHHRAKPGKPGGPARKTGASGEDVIIEVPPGTVIRDAETGEIVLEILQDGEEKILLRGGRGGRGNYHFRSPTNRSPRYAEKGEPGIGKWFIFELKLLADAGLVGFPNAGKSSLLRRVSSARPRVADYPFTTLEPHLGVVEVSPTESFVLADLPGLIEGAHQGKGLGFRFLRHIERTDVLIYVLAPDLPLPPREQYTRLQQELKQYHPALLQKPFLIIWSKADLLPSEKREELQKQFRDLPVEKMFVSSVTGENLDLFKRKIYHLLHRARTLGY